MKEVTTTLDVKVFDLVRFQHLGKAVARQVDTQRDVTHIEVIAVPLQAQLGHEAA
jgi:hypothetical protein